MVFSSIIFLFYFLPIVCVAYFSFKNIKAKNIILFISSLLFYAWGEPLYVFLMLFSIFLNFISGKLMDKFSENIKKKKAVLILCIIINLLMLGVFKYGNFFIENINSLTGLNISLLNLTLPIGISFYTFQSMSYVIDLYRKKVPVQKSIISFGTYVALFPQLIAGPIVRYGDIALMLDERKESFDKFSSGVMRFICGLGKKVLLANNIGILWDTIHQMNFSNQSVLSVWLGVLAFSFQLYFDFSGYSDMAIGLGKMFGFDFLENFNYPYISKTITEFWRRWHISLGTWFLEYVYIPLGGNKKGIARMFLNLFITWMLTGMWHGASWNFILWGIYYGVVLMIEKAFLLKILKKLPSFVSHIYSLLIIFIGWALFACESLGECINYAGGMLGLKGLPLYNAEALYYLKSYLIIFIVILIGSTPLPKKIGELKAIKKIMPLLALICFIVSMFYLVDSTYNPFLYFRF